MVQINNAINNTVGGSNSGVTNTFTVINSSNTASSAAQSLISVGGSTADDPYITCTITGAQSWAFGADNSASDQFKISAAATLGTNDSFSITTTGDTSVLRGDFTVSRNTAGTILSTILNSNNASGVANATAFIQVGGASSGDPVTTYSVGGAQTYSIGIDNSDSDTFKISGSATLGTSDLLKLQNNGNLFLAAGNEFIRRSAVGSEVGLIINNQDNTNSSSSAGIEIDSGGTSAGDAFILLTNTSVQSWSLGLDNSDSAKFKISGASSLGTSDFVLIDISGNVVMPVSLSAARPIVTQTGSNTFVATDANTWQKCTSGSAMTLTVPTNASVPFPINTEIDIYQQGAGQVTIGLAGGVSINSAFGNLKIATQFTGASLKKTDTDVWELVGNLTT